MNFVRKKAGVLLLQIALVGLLVALAWPGLAPVLAQTNVLSEAQQSRNDVRTTLGHPGYLVIEGVRDTLAAFSWQQGPGPGRHSLVWAEGTLSLPDTLFLDGFGELDAGVVCQPELSGVGGSGHLVFEDGIYPISEPLVLADGILELHISGGELEVRGDQIRYRNFVPQDRKSQANYVFLAGLILLIIVLLRRARKVMKKH